VFGPRLGLLLARLGNRSRVRFLIVLLIELQHHVLELLEVLDGLPRVLILETLPLDQVLQPPLHETTVLDRLHTHLLTAITAYRYLGHFCYNAGTMKHI
jgi:hypothetical protein